MVTCTRIIVVSGGEENCLNYGYILKIEPKSYTDGFYEKYEKKRNQK